MDGAVTLTPHPGGRRAASFKLTALEKDKATLENPENDFPKKLVYHRRAADSLVITLTGNGKVPGLRLEALEGHRKSK